MGRQPPRVFNSNYLFDNNLKKYRKGFKWPVLNRVGVGELINPYMGSTLKNTIPGIGSVVHWFACIVSTVSNGVVM